MQLFAVQKRYEQRSLE